MKDISRKYKKNLTRLNKRKDKNINDDEIKADSVLKAANGLDDISVPEAGSGANVANSAVQGASMGSAFGPYGMAIGAVAGGTYGAINKQSEDMANYKALRINKLKKQNRSISGVDSTINQKSQVMRRGGKANTKIIEIEGKRTPEIHTDKNFNVKNLGTIPHSKGGNKVEAEEGDIVFPTQNSLSKYKKIAKAISSGDKSTLEKERAKLPDDSSSKNQNGNRGIKKAEPDYMMDEQAREVSGLPFLGIQPKKQAPKNYAGSSAIGNRFPNNRAIAPYFPNPTNTSTPVKPKDTKRYTVDNYGQKKYIDTPGKYPIRQRSTQATSRRPLPQAPNPFKGLLTPRAFTAEEQKQNKILADGNKIAPSNNSLPVSKTLSTTKFDAFNRKDAGTYAPLSTPKTKINSSPVGKKGKSISGNVTPITSTITPTKLSTFKNANIGDGSDLREKPKTFQFTDNSVTKSPSDVITKPDTKSKTNNSGMNNVMQLSGIANNIIQGTKKEKAISESYLDPEQLKYTDRSNSLRRQSNNLATVQSSNARNASGGNIANLRSNQIAANTANLGRQDEINEREMNRADAIDIQNTSTRNQTRQYNLQRKDQYQSMRDGNAAAKQAYIDQAASDLGQLGMAKQEEAYMRSRDDKAYNAQAAGLRSINSMTPNFETDEDGNRKFLAPKKRKGTSGVSLSKYKMKK